MGNAGSIYGELRTAIKTGSYKLACQIAREVPQLDLRDALLITLLGLTKDCSRFERLARGWLAKFIEEKRPTLESIAYAAELLRDVEPGGERAVYLAIEPMMR